ncbi:hypothetical protein AB0N09_21700 [Streptomyces erythrochromogenes]|uniref:hypothetical protein n=1 Tax=Streptomyces erythrochromogenes TaxID=285574 RepID=UPI00342C943C
MTDKIRPEVVTFAYALLLDIRDTTVRPSDWVHTDGSPMTDHERELFGSCTVAELKAVQRLSQADQAFTREELRDLDRVQALSDPYFALLPEGAVMGQAMALMPKEERDQLEEVLERLAFIGRGF